MTPLAAIQTIAAAYRQDLSPETIGIYASALSDIEPALLAAAVREVVATCKFCPAIAEIRRAAARIAGLMPPAPAEVLALIRRADVREPIYRRDGSLAYTERHWRWPEDADPSAIALAESVVARAGEPCDSEGRDLFGWDAGARKLYESDLPALEASALSDLSVARLLPEHSTPRLAP